MELRDKNGMTEQEFLAAYRPRKYEKPSLTADIAIFSFTETKTKLLMIKRGGHPFLGRWALPGGFARKDESVPETAGRELEEETGLKGLPLVSVGLFSSPGRDPRMWVVSEAFVSVVPAEWLEKACAGDDAVSVQWFDLCVERTGRKIRLRFFSPEEEFEVSLLASLISPDMGLQQMKFEVLEDGGLAFDHAEIIGHALHKIQYI